MTSEICENCGCEKNFHLYGTRECRQCYGNYGPKCEKFKAQSNHSPPTREEASLDTPSDDRCIDEYDSEGTQNHTRVDSLNNRGEEIAKLSPPRDKTAEKSLSELRIQDANVNAYWSYWEEDVKEAVKEIFFHKKCLNCKLNICSCGKEEWVVDINVIKEEMGKDLI
ncbi:unnamed protein product [marine sediment metagenome]|uniref:Uncharacterized protein n=1 Tax=marine sediment metagenome TaxID=412755 RepID=X1AFA6_9ZZZZ